MFSHYINISLKIPAHSLTRIRDVTKFEFEFDDVQTSSVFTRFEILMNVLSVLSLNANLWKNLVLRLDFIDFGK